MNSSKEELIELAEIKSPLREKSRRANKVALSNSVTSLSTSANDEGDIVGIFSVTPRHQKKTVSDITDRQTASDVSDDVFVVRAESARPGGSKNDYRKSYKEKISEHIKRIKEKAGTPSGRSARGRAPVERVRRESDNLDVEVENVRNKFKLSGNVDEKRVFFTFEQQQQQDQTGTEADDDKDTKNYFYAFPEKMDYTLATSEIECIFIPSSKAVDVSEKMGKTEPQEGNIRKMSKRHKNLLENRLLSEDGRKWFDSSGNLLFAPNPITASSLKPIHPPRDRHTTFYKPALTMDECDEIIVVENKILNVYIARVKFTHHPLFSTEHVLAEILHSLVERYTHAQKTLDKLRSRLEALRNEQNRDEHVGKMREKYFEECGKLRHDLKRVLETWRAIKAIREHQNYANTKVKLAIRKVETDAEVETEANRRMLEDAIEEQGELNDEEGDSRGNSSCPDDGSEETVRQKLTEKYGKLLKPPGEPILNFQLVDDHEITEDGDHVRRNVASNTKFYVRILCKEIEACRTEFLGADEQFSVEVDETFALQLTEVPDTLSVEIFEQPKSLSKKKVGEIRADVPGKDTSGGRMRKKEFEKDDIVHYKHTGVGSGVELKTLAERAGLNLVTIENCTLKTSGYVEYAVEWEKPTKKEDSDHRPKKFGILNEIIDKNCVVNLAKVRETIENGNLEVMTEDFATDRDAKCFRLNPYQKPLIFCNITELEENIRLKLLRLRDRKEIEFDGLLVPNRIKEIPFDVLADYQRRKGEEERASSFQEAEEEEDDYDNVPAQRNAGRKHLKRIYLRLFQLCKNTENNLVYESVVDEKYLVHFNLLICTLLRNLLNWFSWRPKIHKPLPVLRKKSENVTQNEAKSNVSITVRVLCAKNVPNRTKATFNDEETEENEVQPFVRVMYKNLTARTSTSKGTDAVWNEILTVPLEASNIDYLNPNSLDGSLVVDLFDESDEEIKKLNKKCANWLGSISISVSSICCSESMKGFFRVKLPHVLLGYVTEEEKQRTKSPKKSNIHSCHYTYLQMEISVQPNVPKLNPNTEELPCREVPYIQEHVSKWQAAFNNSHPNRRFRALALDANGKTACVTRFIKAAEPPQINVEEFDVSVEQCLRYVSLIPLTDCNCFYDCVWLSTDQLINLMLGSITDHAIALTCYLLALKIDVWLLLGYGIPHGRTAYVLMRENNSDATASNYYILDVVYNEKYQLTDEFCPLQKIFCIINGSNVWANTQKSDNLTTTRFDLAKKSDWLPLFNDDLPAPTSPIANKVMYRAKADTEMLELHLERQLKRQIAKLRQLDRTTWNTGLSSVLANAISSFEINLMYNKNHFEAAMELNDGLSPYNVQGFALNVPLTTVSSVVKKIKSLGVHIQRENDTEFAVAVHVHSYVGFLLSVWVFVINVKNN